MALAPFFICTLQVALVSLQEFLSYMESHRQRGHRMFENMRTNHLQVGPHIIKNARKKILLKTRNVVFVLMLCFMLFWAAPCATVTSQRVGAGELQLVENGSRAAEGESCVWPRPGCVTEPRLGSRCRRRTQPDQIAHPQKGSEEIQTGITIYFGGRSLRCSSVLGPTDPVTVPYVVQVQGMLSLRSSMSEESKSGTAGDAGRQNGENISTFFVHG